MKIKDFVRKAKIVTMNGKTYLVHENKKLPILKKQLKKLGLLVILLIFPILSKAQVFIFSQKSIIKQSDSLIVNEFSVEIYEKYIHIKNNSTIDIVLIEEVIKDDAGVKYKLVDGRFVRVFVGIDGNVRVFCKEKTNVYL